MKILPVILLGFCATNLSKAQFSVGQWVSAFNLEYRCPFCYCGMTGMDESWRVVGGWPTKPKEHPWMVALVVKRSNKLFCGGTLISDIYVLTAAHCLRSVKAEDIEVVLSEGDHVDMKPGMGKRRNVVLIKSHEEFHHPRAYNNDIALLKLHKTVQLTPDRPPICLPKLEHSFAGEMARVLGWGLTSENGTRSSWLQEANVPILSQRTCRGLSGFMTITEGMLCASPLDGGVDACQGDSGGPLLIKEEDDRVAIAGIVSWGIGCARPKKPGIYTRVNHYLDWIVRNTQDEWVKRQQVNRTLLEDDNRTAATQFEDSTGETIYNVDSSTNHMSYK